MTILLKPTLTREPSVEVSEISSAMPAATARSVAARKTRYQPALNGQRLTVVRETRSNTPSQAPMTLPQIITAGSVAGAEIILREVALFWERLVLDRVIS